MLRHWFCIGVALCAASLCAETALEQHGETSKPRIKDEQPPQYQDDNLFRTLNEREAQRIIKLKGTKDAPKPEDVIDRLEKQGVRNAVPAAAAAICPICKQKYARHGDPGFRCIPVDSEGNLLPFPEILWKKVHCPCCGVDFRAAMPGKTNNKDGADRDFCEHSIGKTVVHSKVWTCPDCGYAALIDSFGLSWDKTPISDETKAFVQKEIRPVMFMRMCKLAGIKSDAVNNKEDRHGLRDFAKWQEDDWLQAQDMISDWIKYDNAIKIYKHQNAPPSLMAFLYLEAAYACRREMSSEVSVSELILEIEERLGLSIRRINHDLNAAAIQIRRTRNEASLTDPNKMETDPTILSAAAELILEMGELDGRRYQEEARRNGGELDPANFYSSGDMFVLCIRYAGFLDRLGRMEQAARQLEKAKSFIANPDADHTALGDKQVDFNDLNNLRKFVNTQLQHLRDFVDDRAACLHLENDCLNRAVWENVLALHQKSVHFIDPNNLLAPPDKSALEPAISAYMIGEMARRCDDSLTGPAFLAAADTIYAKQLAELKKEEDALAATKDQPDAQAALARAKQLRQSWSIMRVRTGEQLTLALQPRKNDATPEPLNEKFKEVLDKLLQAGGVDAAAFKIPLPVTPKTVPVPKAAAVPAKTAVPAAPARLDPSVSTGSLKTRDELYKMYYAAIVRYVKEKKANPPSLSALVEANYVPRENACLTEKGNLICPETHEALQYYPKFDLGDPNNLVIFQTVKPKDGKSLFADGKIGTFAQRQ